MGRKIMSKNLTTKTKRKTKRKTNSWRAIRKISKRSQEMPSRSSRNKPIKIRLTKRDALTSIQKKRRRKQALANTSQTKRS